MRQNYAARFCLEPKVLLMAYPNIDSDAIATMKEYCEKMSTAETTALYSIYEHELHKTIYNKCGNVYIVDFFSQMMDSMIRIGAKAGRNQERRNACIMEWNTIIDALERHNPQKAMMVFQEHIHSSYEAFCQNNNMQEALF